MSENKSELRLTPLNEEEGDEEEEEELVQTARPFCSILKAHFVLFTPDSSQ